MFRIGELADRAGVSKRTIDYYTQMGLLQPEPPTSKYRYYAEVCLTRLKLIEAYKSDHLTLEEIRDRLALLDELKEPCSDLVDKLDTINAQLKALQQDILALKPQLARLDETQLSIVNKELAVHGTAFLQTLIILLGENPLL